MSMRLTAIVGSLLLLQSPAFAQTGAELQRHCSAPRGSSERIACTAFISGLSAGIYLGESLGASGRRFCFPDDSSPQVDQAVGIVQKYLHEHPEQLHEQAGFVGTLALHSVFSCKK